mgnify:CR=1 FL=1
MKKVILSGLILILVQACSSSYLQESIDVSKTKKSYDKILVVTRSSDKASRIRSERALVSKLAENGIQAIASHEEPLTSSIPEKSSEAQARAVAVQLSSKGYQGIIVTNLVDTQQYTDVIPGSTTTSYYPVRYGRYGRYVGAYPVSSWEPDRLQTGVEYILETCLYDIRVIDGDNLEWVGRFKVRDPSDLNKVTEKYVKELVEALMESSIQ